MDFITENKRADLAFRRIAELIDSTARLVDMQLEIWLEGERLTGSLRTPEDCRECGRRDPICFGDYNLSLRIYQNAAANLKPAPFVPRQPGVV